jgi:hypothetical protein
VELESQRVQVNVTLPQGSIPLFANAAIVNLVGNNIMIDFGFVDPVTVTQMMQQQLPGLTPPLVSGSLVARITLGSAEAEQLKEHLERILNMQKVGAQP